MIDRDLQHYILCELRDAYPNSVDYSNRYSYGSEEYHKFVANLVYLRSHGLISKESVFYSKTMDLGDAYQPAHASITHIGLDFLEDDGGLSAILNTVTVKFEADQLRQMLESKIKESNLSKNEKSSAISVIKELPAESIKHLTTRALDYGLNNISVVKLTELINSIM